MRFLVPICSYLLTCLLCMLIPASEGYDGAVWKLMIGQVFAIPVFLVVSFGLYFGTKKRTKQVNPS